MAGDETAGSGTGEWRILIPNALFEGSPDVERRAVGPKVAFDAYRARSADAVPHSVWRGCHAIITFDTPIQPETVARLESCRIIVRAGVGVEDVDLVACGTRGIPVCNVPEYGTAEVADHAIALMLALARGIAVFDERLRADPTSGWDWRAGAIIRRLSDQRFGVVGLGRIGLAAAQRARAFGMEVAFFDPYLSTDRQPPQGFLRAGRLTDLLTMSDVVSLHCPLTKETRDIINRDSLAAMRAGSILINTSRGRLVDTDALYEALRSGRIDGAGVDVWPEEPPDASHPLLAAWRRGEDWIVGRFVLTPHAAFYSPASFEDLRRKAAETAIRYLAGGALKNCVNGDSLRKQ